MFSFHKDVIGTEQFLLLDNNGKAGSWRESIPEDAYLYSEALKDNHCLDTILKLSATKINFNVPIEYQKAAKYIFGTNVIRWKHILPKYVFERSLRDFITQVVVSNFEGVLPYYESTWGHINRFLSTLQPFATLADTEMKIVKYDRLSTRTGRLIVQDGHRILTMPREERKFIKTNNSFEKFYIDFIALEPTIIARLVNADFDSEDLYVHLSNKFLNNVDRTQAKKIIVSSIYGANSDNHKSDIAKIIYDWFQIDQFASSIRNKAINNKIINFYGKYILSDKINDDGCIINDFIQSTAVDAAIFGFESICDLYALNPLAIIHDAIIVEDKKQKLYDGLINNIIVPGIGKLYFKVTSLNHE